MTSWLTLQEYSNKQGISISTLRRKIKGRELEYTFKKGKYLLKAPLGEGGDFFSSKEELKAYYQKLLREKEEDIQKLKEDQGDLLYLLDCLEKEKSELLKYINTSETAFADFLPSPK